MAKRRTGQKIELSRGGEVKVFDTKEEAAKFLGISTPSIYNNLRGIVSAGGWRARWIPKEAEAAVKSWETPAPPTPKNLQPIIDAANAMGKSMVEQYGNPAVLRGVPPVNSGVALSMLNHNPISVMRFAASAFLSSLPKGTRLEDADINITDGAFSIKAKTIVLP